MVSQIRGHLKDLEDLEISHKSKTKHVKRENLWCGHLNGNLRVSKEQMHCQSSLDLVSTLGGAVSQTG